VSRFLTVQEVADQMRCEHRTVRRAIKRGELEAALIGGRWLVRESAVEAWFESRARGAVVTVQEPRRRGRRVPAKSVDHAGSVARLEGIDQRAVTG
jgi:excisionase family DNA binding protein